MTLKGKGVEEVGKFFKCHIWLGPKNGQVKSVQLLSTCKAGVSNSNWLEGHILKEKCSAGRSLKGKKLTRAANHWKSSKNKINLFKIYDFVNFWDVRGPQKCIRRSTCGPRAWDLPWDLGFTWTLSFRRESLFLRNPFMYDTIDSFWQASSKLISFAWRSKRYSPEMISFQFRLTSSSSVTSAVFLALMSDVTIWLKSSSLRLINFSSVNQSMKASMRLSTCSAVNLVA